jgi:hypothetical protein
MEDFFKQGSVLYVLTSDVIRITFKDSGVNFPIDFYYFTSNGTVSFHGSEVSSWTFVCINVGRLFLFHGGKYMG